MVVPPPLADLRHPADQWQTVFAATALLAEKLMQNADRCDIEATVSGAGRRFLANLARLFSNTGNGKAAVRDFRVVGRNAAERLRRWRVRRRDGCCNRAPLFNVR